jgi:hypothetical protein
MFEPARLSQIAADSMAAYTDSALDRAASLRR